MITKSTRFYALIFVLISGTTISSSRAGPTEELAIRIHSRIAGVPPTSAQLSQLVSLLGSATPSFNQMKAATSYSVQDHSFINISLRDMFSARFNRAHLPTGTNDLLAKIMFIVNANRDFREILTDDSAYRLDQARIPSLLLSNGQPFDLHAPNLSLRSQNHYLIGDQNGIDFAEYLIPYPNLTFLTSTGIPQVNPSPTPTAPFPVGPYPIEDRAGIFSSLTYMGELVAGTNRHGINLAMEALFCTTMQERRDGTFSGSAQWWDFVNPDVDRNESAFQGTCVTCHAALDPATKVFGYSNYNLSNNGFMQNTRNPLPGFGNPEYQYKMQRNLGTGGNPPTNTIYTNNFNRPGGANADFFEWNGPYKDSGNGLRQFASAIADSRGFHRCMTKVAFEHVCNRPVSPNETQLIESLTQEFEGTLQMKFKLLVALIGAQTGCIL